MYWFTGISICKDILISHVKFLMSFWGYPLILMEKTSNVQHVNFGYYDKTTKDSGNVLLSQINYFQFLAHLGRRSNGLLSWSVCPSASASSQWGKRFGYQLNIYICRDCMGNDVPRIAFQCTETISTTHRLVRSDNIYVIPKWSDKAFFHQNHYEIHLHVII